MTMKNELNRETSPAPTAPLEVNRVILGDCLAVLRGLPDACVDAVVTDPPAGVGFMGVAWDTYGAGKGAARADDEWDWTGSKERPRTAQAQQRVVAKQGRAFRAAMEPIFAECLRVLRPGGHALVWALPRTSHWTATALEDAGFEVRDRLAHIFGSGFPKSLDVSKAIDKAGGDALAWRRFSHAYAEAVKVSPYTHSDIDRYLGVKSSSCYWARTDHRGGMPPRHHWDRVRDLLNLPADFERLYDEAERAIIAIGKPKGKSHGVYGDFAEDDYNYTAPSTDAARAWDGWGTALKPAVEDWWLVRKPLAEPTVAANVLAHGTGALNIAASRVATHGQAKTSGGCKGTTALHGGGIVERAREDNSQGRWPANLVLSHSMWCREVGVATIPTDTHYPARRGASQGISTNGMRGQEQLVERSPGVETVTRWECVEGCPVAELDRQSGITKSGGYPPTGGLRSQVATYGKPNARGEQRFTSSEGGASRYFATFRYQAKASRAERNRGCAGLNVKAVHRYGAGLGQGQHPEAPVIERNSHPTVKPLALMSWLITLITPAGGVVLDPFAGSGSTLVAAKAGGWQYLGIEREVEYVAICEARLQAAENGAEDVAEDASYASLGSASVAHVAPTPTPKKQMPARLPRKRKPVAITPQSLSLFEYAAAQETVYQGTPQEMESEAAAL